MAERAEKRINSTPAENRLGLEPARLDVKSMTGTRSSVHHYQATEESLRRFCEAVGARYREEAPPTYMTIFRQGEFEILDKMSIPLKNVLHADQEYRYVNGIRAGDSIEFETVLTRAFEKGGSTGLMRFFVFDTEVRARRESGLVVIGSAKSTIISRQA